MSEMFANTKEEHVCINNLLLITTMSWENHLEKLDESLGRPNQAGLKAHSKVLVPLTLLTSKTTPWKWVSNK
eukprot:12538824-Ditylum_brightwellii.AAC.1